MSAVENRPAAGAAWTGRAPCGNSLQISRDERGVWHVVYGGFSRASGATLRAALAEASGADHNATWLAEIEHHLTAAA